MCVSVRGGTQQLCIEQYKANPGIYFLHLLAFKKKKKGGVGGEDTVGFVPCWPMEKSWKSVDDGACQASWGVFAS